MYAFLASKYGRALVTKDQYGATVKHIEAKHVASIPMPLAPRSVRERIDDSVQCGYRMRDEANGLLDQADEAFHRTLGLPSFDASQVDYIEPESNEESRPVPRAFGVPSVHLGGRLDASYHVPVVRSVQRRPRAGEHPVVQLGDISADVVVAPRFKRVYVRSEFGIPLLQGSHVPQLMPRDLQYIEVVLVRWTVRGRN